jgi:ATP-binding cassette, subfamily B, bacterial
LTRTLMARHGEPHRAGIENLLDGCGVAARRRGRAIDAILRERLRFTLVTTVWPLRTPPGAGFAAQLAAAGVWRRAALLCGVHAAEYLLWIAAWFLLGRDTLAGRLDMGVLAAWALVLATIVPFRLWTTWLQGAVAIPAGGILRERLLDGALQLRPEEVRQEGAGRFLGRAMETQTIESLALSGGLLPAMAAFELCLAAAVLSAGVAGAIQVPLLGLIAAVTVALAWRYYRQRDKWTAARLEMTHDLVERMTGHRTRLAQEPAGQRHTEEDQAAQQYVALAERMDRAGAMLTGLAPRLWLVAGIAALAPAFVGSRTTPGEMGVSMGGLLLAWQAFRRLTVGLANLAGAAISWRQVAPLFHASARGRERREGSQKTEARPQFSLPSLPAYGQARTADDGTLSKPGETVVQARDLAYTYPGRGRRVLEDASLEIRRGDWLLLEGPSGGGKSTLVSLLAGLRTADSGLLLAGGVDCQTLGTRLWRKRIALAPQYQENHVFSAPLAFNLLMGRQWPPRPADLGEAEEVCRELGLGPLLERMPGGMMQMVGETGWQLSQGERSRVFLARALLQNAELAILDESFGALDPESLRQSLECVLRRSKTLMVVDHP